MSLQHVMLANQAILHHLGRRNTPYKMLQLIIVLISLTAVFADQEPECKAIVKLEGPTVNGNVTFVQGKDNQVFVSGVIVGLPAGEYGFHIHEKGDITGGCLSAGSHYNPTNMQHGHPSDVARHVGDLGNVIFDDHVCNVNIVDHLISLTGPYSIIGRTLVLHEKADDFGRSSHPDSKKTGNAGGRVACGVVGRASPVYSNDASFAVPSLIFTVLTAIAMI